MLMSKPAEHVGTCFVRRQVLFELVHLINKLLAGFAFGLLRKRCLHLLALGGKGFCKIVLVALDGVAGS